MDKQLAEIKRYMKKENTIAYVHDNEIMLLQREITSSGEEVLIERIFDRQSNSCIGKRTISSSELTLVEFERWKKYFEALTQQAINKESRETRYNVSWDAIECSGVLRVSSVEEQYLEKIGSAERETQKNDVQLRTIENAHRILETVLNEKQRRWYLLSVCENLSARAIAQREGCAHTTVARGLKVIERKIRKFLNSP